MSVLTGEREEWRRILHEGQPKWVRPADETLVLGDGRQVAEAEALYLPPCEPTKIICVHLNYESRRREFGAPEQVTPTYFQKPTTALNSHRGVLNRPADCQYLNYEGEIGVVVGKPMRNLHPEETWNYLAGFVPANDIGCHDFRDTDMNSMLRVKGMDGFLQSVRESFAVSISERPHCAPTLTASWCNTATSVKRCCSASTTCLPTCAGISRCCRGT